MNALIKTTISEAGSRVSDLPLKEVYLHPGQAYASEQPAQISMILGSCAGVCVYSRRQGFGGATHYILPNWDGSGRPSPRYGDVAIETLLQQLRAFGSQPGDLEAMVFGGACMFQAFKAPNRREDHIGSRNVEVAINTLARLGIVIAEKDTGGENGRKVKMHSGTGLVTASLIRNA
jgi:chemotaxis protein CheD